MTAPWSSVDEVATPFGAAEDSFSCWLASRGSSVQKSGRFRQSKRLDVNGGFSPGSAGQGKKVSTNSQKKHGGVCER